MRVEEALCGSDHRLLLPRAKTTDAAWCPTALGSMTDKTGQPYERARTCNTHVLMLFMFISTAVWHALLHSSQVLFTSDWRTRMLCSKRPTRALGRTKAVLVHRWSLQDTDVDLCCESLSNQLCQSQIFPLRVTTGQLAAKLKIRYFGEQTNKNEFDRISVLCCTSPFLS